MFVGKIQNNSFGNLYVGENLRNKILYGETTTTFLNDFNKLKNFIKENKLDKKKFVDILLHEENDSFNAIISSKKQGVPYNPDYKHQINLNTGITEFKRWVNEWNAAYNPKKIEEFKRLDALIAKTDFVELLKNKK